MSDFLKFRPTERGFRRYDFADRYKQNCSLQESSLASEGAIWFGVDDTGPLCEGPSGNRNESIPGRMHLTVGQVAELIPILQAFVETSYLPGE